MVAQPQHRALCLLFQNGMLIDADNALWPLLPPSTKDNADWNQVRDCLLPLIPDLPESLHTTHEVIPRTTGPLVSVDHIGKTTRVTLTPDPDTADSWLEMRQDAVSLALLQPALDHSPNPIWCLDTHNRFLWGNAAFQAFAKDHGGPDRFSRQMSDLINPNQTPRAKRVSLHNEGTHQERWFEVTTQKIETGVLHFATGVDAVVRAEEAQRNFVQTLSKTFANLTTGLAIFDRNRRLALFNPALIDLSGLSAEFLSSRPNLFEFFDKLREKQIMPEPKNYDNWRECMARLIAAASDDRFRETWNLVSGQTFDVTGRPYPDGAIAFLFNDITAEVSLTRGYRTELETMQSSLDAMDDAVAVFSQQGILTMCNAAYQTMWKVEPDTCIADATILDATQEWRTAFHPDPIWPELRDYVTSVTERASWDSELRSKDGRKVICRVDPICYGATMIRFCHTTVLRKSSAETDPLQIVSA